MADVPRAEHARREADEGVERDEADVEVVDQEALRHDAAHALRGASLLIALAAIQVPAMSHSSGNLRPRRLTAAECRAGRWCSAAEIPLSAIYIIHII